MPKSCPCELLFCNFCVDASLTWLDLDNANINDCTNTYRFVSCLRCRLIKIQKWLGLSPRLIVGMIPSRKLPKTDKCFRFYTVIWSKLFYWSCVLHLFVFLVDCLLHFFFTSNAKSCSVSRISSWDLRRLQGALQSCLCDITSPMLMHILEVITIFTCLYALRLMFELHNCRESIFCHQKPWNEADKYLL